MQGHARLDPFVTPAAGVTAGQDVPGLLQRPAVGWLEAEHEAVIIVNDAEAAGYRVTKALTVHFQHFRCEVCHSCLKPKLAALVSHITSHRHVAVATEHLDRVGLTLGVFARRQIAFEECPQAGPRW